MLTAVDRWHDRAAGSWSIDSLFDKSWEIFRHKWPSFITTNPKPRSTRTLLQAGRYEWPFELEIAGSMKESIDGLCNSYISYSLRATIARGRLSSDLCVQQPMRIIRAYPLTEVSSTGHLREEGVLPDKIEYQFSIPQRAIAFGTTLTIHMRLATLLKGLKIAMIKCALMESQQFRMPGTHPGTSFKRHRTVKQWKFEPNCHECTLQEVLQLPKRFSMCAQDMDLFEIEVRHEVQISLDLQNPDGGISEVSPIIMEAE